MTPVGAASTHPLPQPQAISAPPRPPKQDSDGDERTESAASKAAEASPHKLNVQA